MFSRIPKIRNLSIFAVAALFSVAFAPGLHASAMNERTLVTVNAPVEVPGQVLPAGTYSFKVLNFAGSGGQVVAIRNAKSGHFISYVMATPIYRVLTPTKAIVTLAERPSDNPPAIHKWFYPGFNTGLEFTYFHSQQQKFAAAKMSKTHTDNG